MAWPWLAIIAKNVPWVELARRAPDIWAKSRELLDESRRGAALRPPSAEPSLAELRRRVDVLEQRDAEHALLLASMVEQLQALTDVVQVLSARNKLLMWLSVVLLVALAATFIVLRAA